MEIILFTLNAIVIYFLADWIVRQIESRRDKTLQYRQAVFFVVMLVLALTSFRLLQTLLAE